jgi:methylmalonyl-CoA mutase C-terminal domain/subunit
MTLFPRLLDLLKAADADDIILFGGWNDPTGGRRQAEGNGVAELFTPGASTIDIVQWVKVNVGGVPEPA